MKSKQLVLALVAMLAVVFTAGAAFAVLPYHTPMVGKNGTNFDQAGQHLVLDNATKLDITKSNATNAAQFVSASFASGESVVINQAGAYSFEIPYGTPALQKVGDSYLVTPNPLSAVAVAYAVMNAKSGAFAMDFGNSTSDAPAVGDVAAFNFIQLGTNPYLAMGTPTGANAFTSNSTYMNSTNAIDAQGNDMSVGRVVHGITNSTTDISNVDDLVSSVSLVAANDGVAIFNIELKQDLGYLTTAANLANIAIDVDGTDLVMAASEYVGPFTYAVTYNQGTTGNLYVLPSGQVVNGGGAGLTLAQAIAAAGATIVETSKVSLQLNAAAFVGINGNSKAMDAGNKTVADAAPAIFSGADFHDIDFDGYVDTIYINGLEALGTLSADGADFQIAYFNTQAATPETWADKTIITGTTNITAVELADRSDLIDGNDAIKLTIKDDLITTGETINLRMLYSTPLSDIQDAAGNKYMPANGVDLYNFAAFTKTAADYVSWQDNLAGPDAQGLFGINVADQAAPAILSGVVKGNTVELTLSENSAGVVAASDAGDYLVFLDKNGYIMDVTNWTVTLTALDTLTVAVNAAGANVEAEDTAQVYISQSQAAANLVDTAAGNIAGCFDPADTTEKTYDKYRTVQGTIVSLSNKVVPVIENALALWEDDAYRYILAKVSEDVTLANTSANGSDALENCFKIHLSTEDTVAVDQVLAPEAVTLQTDSQLLITIPHVQQWSYNANSVRPVRLEYVDPTNEGNTTTTKGYVDGKDSDVLPMGNQTVAQGTAVAITVVLNNRNADVRAVEVYGAVQNFSDIPGSQIKAYEAYKILDRARTVSMDISFEFGPLASKVQNAFGLTSKNDGTDQCEQEGVYTGITIDTNTGVGMTFIGASNTNPAGTAAALIEMINDGVAYLHTDANSDNIFDLELNSNPDSASAATSAAGDFSASDSVFVVTFKTSTKKDGVEVKVSGNYGIKGSGYIEEVYTEEWHMYDGTGLANLANPVAAPVVVGQAVIPFDSTTGEYKIVCNDPIGTALNIPEDQMTAAQKSIASRLIERKVVLTLTDINNDVFLLNGVTPDVEITYNFYDKDGTMVFNPDYNKIFGYPLTQNAWNILPLAINKTYSTKTSDTKKAVYKVGDVSDAIIGLGTVFGAANVPVVAQDNAMLFGLNSDGVTFARASAIEAINGGYAYAVEENAAGPLNGADNTINADSLFTFGYVIGSTTDYTQKEAVVAISDPKKARSSKNNGWNLISNVTSTTLSSTGNIDYVITFDGGDFDSWIQGADSDLLDFTSLTNDYSADEEDLNDYGKGYFVHTSAAD